MTAEACCGGRTAGARACFGGEGVGHHNKRNQRGLREQGEYHAQPHGGGVLTNGNRGIIASTEEGWWNLSSEDIQQ